MDPPEARTTLRAMRAENPSEAFQSAHPLPSLWTVFGIGAMELTANCGMDQMTRSAGTSRLNDAMVDKVHDTHQLSCMKKVNLANFIVSQRTSGQTYC